MTLSPAAPPTRPQPERTAFSARGALGGLGIGVALGALAVFLGEVRGSVAVFVTLLALCGVAGGFRPTRRALHGVAGVVAALLAVALLTPVLRAPLAALTLSQAPAPADAIVVLGGGVQCGTRTLEASSQSKLLGGLELWRAGYAPIVTVSEQSGLIGQRDCAKMSAIEAAQIRALYPSGGPEVLTLRHVTTTRDEAARVSAYAKARGWKRVLVVTTPSHSRRAQALFTRYGVEAVSVPTGETRFDQTLPTPSDRLYAVRILAYEWLSRLKDALGGTPER